MTLNMLLVVTPHYIPYGPGYKIILIGFGTPLNGAKFGLGAKPQGV